MCSLMVTGCIIMVTRFDVQFVNASPLPGQVFAAVCAITGVSVLFIPWIFPTGKKIDHELERDQYTTLALQRLIQGSDVHTDGFDDALELGAKTGSKANK